MFLQGTGDVLLAYENEAINIERQGKPVEHVNPPQTFKIENPVAVVNLQHAPGQGHRAEELPLHPGGPEDLGARPGSGPSIPRSPRTSPTDFPTPQKLWTIADLGGWSAVDPALFDKDNG